MDLVKVSTVRLSIKIGDGDGEFHLVLVCLKSMLILVLWTEFRCCDCFIDRNHL